MGERPNETKRIQGRRRPEVSQQGLFDWADQFTPDGDPGDKIGAFEGRVIALGGAMTYNFGLGKIPVSTSARVYREFDAENRLQGTAGWLTMAIPLP